MVSYPLYLFGRLPDAEIDYRVLLQHKEKARESCLCLSRHSGSRIAFPPRISNTEAHA